MTDEQQNAALREVVPAEPRSVRDEEWESKGSTEIPDPDDEEIAQLGDDLAADPGDPFIRCQLAAALERIGMREAACE
jgi:hypothetical protein